MSKVCVLILLFGATASNGQQQPTPTNLDLFRFLARKAATEVVQQTNVERSTKIHLTVLPKESGWLVASAISDGLKSEGFIVGEEAAAPYAADFGLSMARVRYANLRREGFLGARLVDRTIDIQLATKIVSRQSGTILWSRDIEKSMTDTVEVSNISNLENPAILVTKGTIPSESFFSNVGEPLILIGSIAVAVLLLFNVRS